MFAQQEERNDCFKKESKYANLCPISPLYACSCYSIAEALTVSDAAVGMPNALLIN
jgi:hypothetical protein